MRVEHVPLLKIARDLHDIPRGPERFRAYLAATLADDGQSPRYPPLVALNPMGREHVAERIDQWLALGAEALAEAAIAEACPELGGDGDWRHGLVVVDDVKGGWTNRWAVEMGLRVADDAAGKQGAKYRWLSTVLFVREEASADLLRRMVREALARYVYCAEHGAPANLGEVMAQEGAVARFAGTTYPLDEDDLEYSRAVLEPLRSAVGAPTILAALFGDAAARELGHRPLGLSPWAGLAVAAQEGVGWRPDVSAPALSDPGRPRPAA